MDDKRPWRRSPLTGRQVQRLFAAEHGIVLLWGTSMAGLDDVHGAVNVAVERADNWSLKPFKITDSLADIREALKVEQRRKDKEHKILLLRPDAAWSVDWIEALLDDLSRRPAPTRCVRLVAVGDPAMCWEWLRNTERRRRLIEDRRLQEIFLEPWSRGTIDQLQIEQLDLLEGALGAEKVNELTGRWGPRLTALVEASSGRPIEECVERYLNTYEPRALLQDVMNLDHLTAVFEMLRELEHADLDSLAGLLEIEPDDARVACEFSLSLGLVRGTLDNLTLDPVVSQALVSEPQAS